jgi:hypothetical protein
MGQARIGRIRMKAGGAEVRVLHTPRHHDLDEADWRSLFVKHATTIAEDKRPITGYFMLAVFGDGGFNSASRVDFTLCPVPLTLWPPYVEEVARRKLVTSVERAEDDRPLWEVDPA